MDRVDRQRLPGGVAGLVVASQHLEQGRRVGVGLGVVGDERADPVVDFECAGIVARAVEQAGEPVEVLDVVRGELRGPAEVAGGVVEARQPREGLTLEVVGLGGVGVEGEVGREDLRGALEVAGAERRARPREPRVWGGLRGVGGSGAERRHRSMIRGQESMKSIERRNASTSALNVSGASI